MIDLTSLKPYGIRDNDLGQWRFPCPICHIDEWCPVVVTDTGQVFCENLNCNAEKDSILRAWNIPVSNGDRPASFLEKYRCNLMAMRREGIPPREYVPGCFKMFAKGKRHHLAAPLKTGKTLTIAVRQGIEIVKAGGVVVVLDRENGADEYMRRLDDVLRGMGADEELEALVERNYRYYDWPSIPLEMGKSKLYPLAFEGADIIFFDATRKFLTNLNLNEDSADDFSRFADHLIDPLSKAGIATFMLDNTGKENTGARGTITKGDLADVVFAMEEIDRFNKDETGEVRLKVAHSRLGEIHGSWTMRVGGGVFDPWVREDAPPEMPTKPKVSEEVMEAVSEILEGSARPLSTTKIRSAVKGNASRVDDALDALIRQGYVKREIVDGIRGGKTNNHSLLKPFRAVQEGTLSNPV